MSLKARITDDMKSAMRAKDKARLSAIRLILTAIKQVEIDSPTAVNAAAPDEHILPVLNKLAKQRRDAIQQYKAADRDDLASKEADELAIIQEYLPPPLSDSAIDDLIVAAIEAVQADSPKAMGQVIAYLKPQLQGRADMGQVSKKIKAMLSGS